MTREHEDAPESKDRVAWATSGVGCAVFSAIIAVLLILLVVLGVYYLST